MSFCSKNKNGFTLIEMMVAVAIITILTTVFLLSRSTYTDRLNLKNQAYALASMVRKAQSYSLGVRADSGNFDTAYGVFFAACPNQDGGRYFFFTDQNKDGKTGFDGSPPSTLEPGQKIDFSTNFKIKKMYVNGSAYPSANNCNSAAPGQPTQVFITFQRPSPEARFYFQDKNGTAVAVGGSYVPPVCLRLENENNGDKMGVKIDTTGQVAIQMSCP